MRDHFSFLKELKLRSTITNNWLTNLLILHIHKLLTDRLDLLKVADDFDERKEETKLKFGFR